MQKESKDMLKYGAGFLIIGMGVQLIINLLMFNLLPRYGFEYRLVGYNEGVFISLVFLSMGFAISLSSLLNMRKYLIVKEDKKC